MIVSAILYVTLCTSQGCQTGTVAKFYQGEGGALICEGLAEQINRVDGDEPGEHSLYVCKRQAEGTRG